MDSDDRIARIREIDDILSAEGRQRMADERAILIWQEQQHRGHGSLAILATEFGRSVGAINQAIARAKAITTEVFSGMPGRSLADYELLDEMVAKHGLDRRDAHDSIRAFLDDIVAIDDTVILSRRPVNPRLLEHNPTDLDVTYWETISEKTADEIRAAFAAVYPGEDQDDE